MGFALKTIGDSLNLYAIRAVFTEQDLNVAVTLTREWISAKGWYMYQLDMYALCYSVNVSINDFLSFFFYMANYHVLQTPEIDTQETKYFDLT